MKSRIIFFMTIILGIVAVFSSCNKEESVVNNKAVYLDLPSQPYQYNGSSPDEQVALGRVLFYDPRLSVNNSISCATCHKQELAFSDNMAFSRGFQNKLTGRNTLPIQNLDVGGFFESFNILFWDGRDSFLNEMVLKPILNHVEMGMDDEEAIVARVKSAPYYGELFHDAFGDSEIDIDKIAAALGAFTGSITSGNTLFDKHNLGIATLSGIEEHGKNLFFTKYDCTNCHTSVVNDFYNFNPQFLNIGLDMNYADNGVGALTNNAADNGKFKIPNLRNIALTAPYMHDGRFATLEEVIDHYSQGIASHPNLDFRLKGEDGQAMKMNISAQDKSALVAFLNTMTDYSMITDPKFSNPFKSK